MKKVLLSAVILSCMGLKAQVGINTTDPKASLEVAYDDAQGSKVQAIGLPHVTTAQRNDFKHEDLKDGQMIYNVTSKCVEVCIDKTWKCLSSTEGGLPQPTNPVAGTATFASLSNIEKNIVSTKYGNQSSDKIQGKITATRIPVKIPYTGATAGSVEETILLAESNSHLKLKIKQATIADGEGALDAEIYYDNSGDYNLPLVTLAEINQGNIKKATDVTFKVKVNGVINPATVQVNSLGGIPDKLFGQKTNGKYEHQFIYVPIKGPDGKWWLNNDLGAAYARVNNPVDGVVDPTRQATHMGDFNAYGSIFQYGRSELTGYELIDWTGTESGQAKYPNKGWYSVSSLGSNWNPCPNGYRLPTEEELGDYLRFVGANYDKKPLDESMLRLPMAGVRESNGTLWFRVRGRYWTSTDPYDGTYYYGRQMAVNLNWGSITASKKDQGFAARCVKN